MRVYERLFGGVPEESDHEAKEKLAKLLVWRVTNWVHGAQGRVDWLAIMQTAKKNLDSNEALDVAIDAVGADRSHAFSAVLELLGPAALQPLTCALMDALFGQYKDFLQQRFVSGVEANNGGVSYRLYKALDANVFDTPIQRAFMHVYLSTSLQFGINTPRTIWRDVIADDDGGLVSEEAPVACELETAFDQMVAMRLDWLLAADNKEALAGIVQKVTDDYQQRLARYARSGRSKEVGLVAGRLSTAPVHALLSLWSKPHQSWCKAGRWNQASLNQSLVEAVAEAFVDHIDQQLRDGIAPKEQRSLWFVFTGSHQVALPLDKQLAASIRRRASEQMLQPTMR